MLAVSACYHPLSLNLVCGSDSQRQLILLAVASNAYYFVATCQSFFHSSLPSPVSIYLSVKEKHESPIRLLIEFRSVALISFASWPHFGPFVRFSDLISVLTHHHDRLLTKPHLQSFFVLFGPSFSFHLIKFAWSKHVNCLPGWGSYLDSLFCCCSYPTKLTCFLSNLKARNMKALMQYVKRFRKVCLLFCCTWITNSN